MRPTAPVLTAVAGGGTLGGAGPDSPGGVVLVGQRRRAVPTIYVKVIQFHPLVVHSSMRIEL